MITYLDLETERISEHSRVKKLKYHLIFYNLYKQKDYLFSKMGIFLIDFV